MMGVQGQVPESRVSLGVRQSHHWEMNPTPSQSPTPAPCSQGQAGWQSSESEPAPRTDRTARRGQQAAQSPSACPGRKRP